MGLTKVLNEMGIVVKDHYDQADYSPKEKDLPVVPRNLDIRKLNRELTKRTLAEKLVAWTEFSRANINVAKIRALKSVGDSTKFRRFLPNFLVLSQEYKYYPCLVVGYGPSFHDEVYRLKELPRNKFKMIAAERCLPEMYYQGVLPDAVINLDSGTAIKHFFFGTPITYLTQLSNIGMIRHDRGENWEPTELGIKTPISDPKSASTSFKRDVSHWINEKFGFIDARHRIIMQMVKDGIGDETEIARRLHVFVDKPVPTNGIDMIAALTTNPDIRKWYRGRIFWFNPTVYPWKNTLTWDLQNETGIGAIPTAGNVGTTTMVVALSLGCEPICLLGVDFCHRVGGFDPSTLAVVEYQAWCPKCRTPHRATVRAADQLPSMALCQNPNCKFIYNPADPACNTICTNSSYKAYAFSMKQLLTSEIYKPLFDKAHVINLSKYSIVRGKFIERSSFDKFVGALKAWDRDKDVVRRAEIESKNGKKPAHYEFHMTVGSYEDETGKYILRRDGLKELTDRGFELQEGMEYREAEDDEAGKVSPIVGLKEVKKEETK